MRSGSWPDLLDVHLDHPYLVVVVPPRTERVVGTLDDDLGIDAESLRGTEKVSHGHAPPLSRDVVGQLRRTHTHGGRQLALRHALPLALGDEFDRH
nr:hypothetical protein [Propionicicella superfundia]